MKYRMLILLTCLLAGGSLVAQSKKELEKSLAAEKAISDSLRKELAIAKTLLDSTQANLLLSDSLSKSADPFKEFYNHMYTRYLMPSLANDSVSLTIRQATSMVDSLVVARSGKLAKADTSMKQSRDTLSKLHDENRRIAIEMESLKRIIAEATGTDRVPVSADDFKGKWEAYLVPLAVVGTAPHTAVLSAGAAGISDSLFLAQQLRIPRTITFGNNDLADVVFMGGGTTNCFYKVVGYDPVKPFYIDLDRGSDLKVRMHAVNTNKGLQVSAELPSGTNDAKRYLFGYLKR